MRRDMNEQYAAITRRQVDKVLRRERLKAIFAGATSEDLDGADDREIDNAPARDHHVSRLADLLCEASDGEVDRPAALRWLMHHRAGRALVAELHKSEKGFPMNRADELESMVRKAGSFTGLCKAVASGRQRNISERELSLCAKGYASKRHPHLSPDVAFSRECAVPNGTEASRAFWSAIETVKNAAPEREVGGALDELRTKAEALRKRQPELSEAQAFTKIYEANPELSRRERAENGF